MSTPSVHIQKISLRNRSTKKLAAWQINLEPPRQPLCAGFAASLNSFFLDTDLFLTHSHNTTDGHCEIETLGMLLERVQNVQTLKLHGNSLRPQADFLQCFRPSLPKLSRLFLFGITTSEQDLTEFLLNHRATLASLKLTLVSLTDSNPGQSTDSWYQVSREVSQKFPSLGEIDLACLAYCPGARPERSLDKTYLIAVEHAILNGTDIPQRT